MHVLRAYVAVALFITAIAQSSNTAAVITLTGSLSATSTAADYATGSDLTYNSNITPVTLATSFTYVSGSRTLTEGLSSTLAAANSTTTGSSNGTILLSTSTNGDTVLSGSARTTTTSLNGTASHTTSSSARPTNTRPCNGYPELCNRKYSNITHVAAHNSPFVNPNNVASNQALDVTTQLNDGIRMCRLNVCSILLIPLLMISLVQFQVHKPNDTSPLMLCHTSCDLLNVGTLLSYLSTVNSWLEEHRYDVVTILMGNYDVLSPSNFTGPVAESGLLQYAYIPETVPMGLDGWPTLAEMILSNKRVVFMLDYEADQATIPWLLDEFSYTWETPFSPTDRDFPCTVDRPPSQNRNISAQRLSLANHNLNIDVAFAGLSILVPAYNLLNVTNGVSGYGSAGVAVSNCTAIWDRPPNFLLVDYYNIGSFNGSVMAVAAEANNVNYNSASCCGTLTTSFAVRLGQDSLITIMASTIVAYILIL
jgi:hypothetical protein